jgi:predicted dehydrogenase
MSSKKISKSVSRRSFVGTTTAAGLGVMIVPRHVLGGPGYRAPSDTLNIACIGVGGMGWGDVNGVSTENIYALCDVDDGMAQRAFAAFPNAKRYKDFRVMLEAEAANIDAVTVSTPDHTHAVAGMMAMALGKHTRIQKPLARTIWEVRELMRAARDSGVATQMGNQGHAQDGTRQIREWVEAGAIGTVREIQYWTNRPIWPQAINRPTEAHHPLPGFDWDLWLGPAPDRPYHPAYAPFRWRGWWDYGTGALGDIACHAMDAAFWTLGLGYPERIEPESTPLFPDTAPAASRIVYHFGPRGDRPAVKVVWRDGNLSPPKPAEFGDDERWPVDSSGQIWVGDDGKLFAGIYGENPRLLDADRHAALMADPPPERYPRTEGVYAEFIEACKGGSPAGSNFVDHAGPLSEMALLGNLAVRTARVLELDSETGTMINSNVPPEYIRPVFREGWGW